MAAPLFPDLIVNGETIPQAVVAQEAQNHDAPKGKPGYAWRKAANAIATRTLLLQEARRRRIATDAAEVGPGRFETDEEALIRGLLESVIDSAAPDEATVRSEWERDPSRFRTPPLWEVSHILIPAEPSDPQATTTAQKLAEQLARTLQSSPKDFARLAKAHSACPSREAGGSLGQIGSGDTLPEFEVALRVMSEGQISASPIQTRHGWHIIRLDASASADVLPFETVRPMIADAMEKAAWARSARAFLAELVRKAEISGADLQNPPEDQAS